MRNTNHSRHQSRDSLKHNSIILYLWIFRVTPGRYYEKQKTYNLLYALLRYCYSGVTLQERLRFAGNAQSGELLSLVGHSSIRRPEAAQATDMLMPSAGTVMTTA